MYKSPELDQIRQRIDALDNQVHDLLMERADLVMQISAEKKKHGIQIVQPAREARMIRRLIKRHRAPLPEETIVRIWRELVGSISLLQTGLSVAVVQKLPEYWDMARDYFGTVLPMQKTSTSEESLKLVKDDKVNFAVLPQPEESEPNAWWLALIENPSLKVIQRLPFGDKENYKYDAHPALIVAKSGFDTSDDDRSLIALPSENLNEAQKLFEVLEVYNSNGKVLLEVNEYVLPNDPRFETIEAVSLGGYPSPLNYGKTQ